MLDAAAQIGMQPLVHQPGSAGIAIGLLYLACLAAALRLWRNSSRGETERTFWMIVSIVVLCAAATEALGLTLRATQMIRALAEAQGWYVQRWGVQIEVLLGCLTLAAVGSLVLKPKILSNPSAARVAKRLSLLLALMAVRIVSLHEIDGLLNSFIAESLTINRLIEGVILVLLLRELLAASRKPVTVRRTTRAIH